jgi:hypothetical protein
MRTPNQFFAPVLRNDADNPETDSTEAHRALALRNFSQARTSGSIPFLFGEIADFRMQHLAPSLKTRREHMQ